MAPMGWFADDELQYDVSERSTKYELSERVQIAQRFEPGVGQKNARRARYEKRRGAGATSQNGMHRRRQKRWSA